MDFSNRETGMTEFLEGLRDETISTERSQSNAESHQFCNEGMGNFLDQLEDYDEAARIEDEAEEAGRLLKAKKPAKTGKKSRGARILNKMLGRDNMENAPAQDSSKPGAEPESSDETCYRDQRPADDDFGLKPSPYVHPLEYNLAARDEVVHMNPANDLISAKPELVEGIHVARHRGLAHKALFGRSQSQENFPTTLKGTSEGDRRTSNESDYIRFQNSMNTDNHPNSKKPLKFQECMNIPRFTDAQEHADVSPEHVFLDIQECTKIQRSTNTRRRTEICPEQAPPSPTQSQLERPPSKTYEEYTKRFRNEELEGLVEYCSPDELHDPSWRQYLESYSRGHFNMSEPPHPPNFRLGFEYLPSFLPPGESSRIQMSSEYEVLWPEWGQEKAADLIRLAMRRFGTSSVSLSFFDEAYEIFKAEAGYNCSHLNRAESFAAHCLFSKDVLVVLDTEKDWRFRKNPLVVQLPKIRFWAGAPMISTCGEVLGVFAIFSAKPRASFTHVERRKLAEFTDLVMQDLKAQLETLRNRVRTTPLLDRDTFDYVPKRPKSIQSVTGSSGIDPDLVPPALTYHKIKTPKPQQPRSFSSRASRDPLLNPSEQTPPSSAESNNGYFDNLSNLRTPDNHCSGEFLMTQEKSFNNSMVFYPSGLAMSTHRPFSDSDLTSLYPHPPNTPVGEKSERELSTNPKFVFDWSDFDKPTDEHCAESIEDSGSDTAAAIRRTNPRDLAGSTIMQPGVTPVEGCVPHIGSQRGCGTDGTEHGSGGTYQRNAGFGGDKFLIRSNSFTRNVTKPTDGGHFLDAPRGQVSSQATPTRNGLRTDTQDPLIDSTTSSEKHHATCQVDERNMVPFHQPSFSIGPSVTSGWSMDSEDLREAATACALYFRDLGYDLIYAVEIKPKTQFMSDEEILKAGGLQKRILVSHGLDHAKDLSSATHLRALRSRGGEYWYNPAGAEGGYQSGRLISIHSDDGGPITKRSSGIVLGAIRMSGRATNGEMLSSAAELERLTNFGRMLKNILRPSERAQTRSNIERPYPTNEAEDLYTKTQSFNDSRSRTY
ncbi:uncharacterized protein RCO7_04505 [Rhynchosporium graminicola]|uniref:GAF domain-containing protein n=1 Tax=Rhynchosporium graminicola TaxID=2792576 RepID=A0A1E1JSH5_9HELO|nr:uncharacterized protein RCO7_04505 [Rhynchosporium commune]